MAPVLAVFNVGDSRGYKVVERGLAQLSVDDSLVQNWKPGSGTVRSSMLTQCFGGRPIFTDIEPHVHVEPCVPGSTTSFAATGCTKRCQKNR
jgi:serine/threonine protein phosphatase PrpC